MDFNFVCCNITSQTAILPQVIKRNDMTKENKLVTIYLPDGTTRLFTTNPDAQDVSIQLVDSIVTEPTVVHIAFKDGEGVEGESFVGMHYHLNMWK